MPYVKVNNKKLFYTLATPNASTASTSNTHFTLLCIHGLGSANSYYTPITPHLTSLGHTVLAIDTHGAGLSPYTGTADSITSIADDALAVLESLQEQLPKDVVVLGHSMGGIVASEITLEAKNRIKGVVLIGPVHPNPGAAEAFKKRMANVSQGLSLLVRSHLGI
jgi:pimeloyl-ACP methyl ester carboxylesterase